MIALVSYTIAFTALMRQRHQDISWFVVAGGAGVDVRQIPPGLSIIPGTEGYDGLSFYRLALDPLTRRATDFGITLDNPPYRQQRLLYPVIVHGLSLGRPEWVPTLLVVCNLLAIVCLTIAAAVVAMQHGLHPLWGLLIPLYPGFFMAFSRDTSEIVAWAFAASALAMAGSSRWIWAAVLLSCAVLSRETTLILALGIAAAFAFQRASRPGRAVLAAVLFAPTIVYVVWQAILHNRWGMSGLEAGAIEPAVPFSMYVRLFAESAARRTVLMRVHFVECVFWLLLVCVVIVILVRTSVRLEWRMAWLAYLALASILSWEAWGEQVSFMRVLGDLYTVSALILYGGPVWARRIIFLATCSVSYYAMSHMR